MSIRSADYAARVPDPRIPLPPPPWPPTPKGTPPVIDPRSKPAWVVTLAGGIAIIVGSFMPWATLGPFSAAGTNGDGTITAVLGALVAIIATIALTKPPLPRRLAVPAFIIALLSAVVTIIDSVNVSRNDAGASVGSGLILCLLGSLAASGGSIVGLIASRGRRQRRAVAPDRSNPAGPPV